MDGSSGLTGSASSRTSRRCGWARPSNPIRTWLLGRFGRRGFGRLRRLLLSRGVLACHHRVAVLHRFGRIQADSARDVGHLLERTLDLGEVAEVELVEGHGGWTQLPHRAVLPVDDQHAKPELLQKVERGVAVLDGHLGLLAHLHALAELRRTFRGEHPARAAVEHAQTQRVAARDLAAAFEAKVLLVVAAFQLSAELAQRSPQPGVVARALEPELELRLDAAVFRLMTMAARHC